MIILYVYPTQIKTAYGNVATDVKCVNFNNFNNFYNLVYNEIVYNSN